MAATPIRFREATLIGADGVVSSAKRDRSGLTTPVCAALVAPRHLLMAQLPKTHFRGVLDLSSPPKD